jgi:hypothetical protein
VLVLLAGCGGGDDKLPQVQGRVFFRGTPLNGGTIVFTPDPDRGGHGPLAAGEIQPDGRYTLYTGQEPGAVPGWHKVTVAPASPIQPPNNGAGVVPMAVLPRQYSHPERSGQVHEVKPGIGNNIDIYLD